MPTLDPAAAPAADPAALPQGQAADDSAAIPAAEAGNGAGEGADSHASAAGAGAQEGSVPTAAAGGNEPKPEPARAPDWRDDRIRVLTARLAEEKARNQAPKSGDGTDAPTDPAAAPRPGKSEAQIRAEIEAEIRAQGAQADFNRRCNEVAQQGATAFPDFNARVAELRRTVTDWNDPSQAGPYMRLLEAAIETGKGPALLHQLGGDLNEAVRLMTLPPIKMAMELTKLASAVDEAPANPKPIPRMGNQGSAHGAIDPTDTSRADNLSTEEWMRRRNEQVAKRPDSRIRA